MVHISAAQQSNFLNCQQYEQCNLYKHCAWRYHLICISFAEDLQEEFHPEDLHRNPLIDTHNTGCMQVNTHTHTYTQLLYYSPSFQQANDCFVSDHPSLFATVQTGFTGVLTRRHHQPYSLHATTPGELSM